MVEDNDKEISQKNRTKTNKQTMGTEFQLCKMKRVFGMDDGDACIVKTVLLNCTSKMIKMINFMLHVFYHNFKKWYVTGAQAGDSLGTVTKFQLLAACRLIAIRRVWWPLSGLFFYLLIA